MKEINNHLNIQLVEQKLSASHDGDYGDVVYEVLGDDFHDVFVY